MAEHTNAYFEKYVKKAYLKQYFIMDKPVPDNLDYVKKLDYFASNILKDKRKQKDLDMDETFEKIQLKF